MSNRGKKIKSYEDGNAAEEFFPVRRRRRPTDRLDNEIVQLTKLRSEPHGFLGNAAPGKFKLPVSSVKMLFGRESNSSGRGRFSSADSCHLLSRYLPINGPQMVDSMNGRVYVSQFSADGSLFVAGSQAQQIRVYNVERGWKVQKYIHTKSMKWAITDTSLSPDKRFLVYASLSPVVHIVDIGSSTAEPFAYITENHEGLNFAGEDGGQFGIFSVKFSIDGRELVAASNDNSIYIYDIESKVCTLSIPAHQSDVNTVCFVDETGNLLYSGGDDRLCKVWDRRCSVTRGRAAGVLMGHLEGVTFIDGHADGCYFISNGKDQTTKLWDIRKMSSNVTFTPRLFRHSDFDYRWMEYPPYARTLRHPGDMSLTTYRGHSVMFTLVRCYFSPVSSTGQKYIYTGSGDSSVRIYDLMSGAEVARLEFHEGPVRDCSWHPSYPMLVSSSWDGTIARWEFPG